MEILFLVLMICNQVALELSVNIIYNYSDLIIKTSKTKVRVEENTEEIEKMKHMSESIVTVESSCATNNIVNAIQQSRLSTL